MLLGNKDWLLKFQLRRKSETSIYLKLISLVRSIPWKRGRKRYVFFYLTLCKWPTAWQSLRKSQTCKIYASEFDSTCIEVLNCISSTLIILDVGRCIVWLLLGSPVVWPTVYTLTCANIVQPSYACRVPVVYPPPSFRLKVFQIHNLFLFNKNTEICSVDLQNSFQHF